MIDPDLSAILRAVVDPYLGENLVDLGLLREAHIGQDGTALVVLAAPTPPWPPFPQVVSEIDRVLQGRPGVSDVEIRLAEEPPWTPYHMAHHLRAPLGLSAAEPPEPQPPIPGQGTEARLFRAGVALGRARSLFRRLRLRLQALVQSSLTGWLL